MISLDDVEIRYDLCDADAVALLLEAEPELARSLIASHARFASHFPDSRLVLVVQSPPDDQDEAAALVLIVESDGETAAQQAKAAAEWRQFWEGWWRHHERRYRDRLRVAPCFCGGRVLH